MSNLKRNVVANYAGNIWSGIISLLFVPLYIRYLGMEAWGLIGFYVTLQSLMAITDMGLSTTLNRQLASMSVVPEAARQRRDLLRTLEVLYWSISAAAGLALVIAAPYVAARWLHVQHLSIDSARQAIRLMGVVMILQLPLALYSGGLLGLQQQVRLNAINIFITTVRGIGSLAVLALVSPTVVAFFVWQVVVSGAQTAIVGLELWRTLGRSVERARFRARLLDDIWRFSASMVGITITSTLVTQVDKIILSRVVSLEAFGYYALASAVAAGLYRVMTPIFVSFFPRLTQLVATGDEETLKGVYHAGSQLATVLVVPIAAVVALFSREILLIWTRNPVTTDRAHLLVTLLITGTAINGLINIPYALQLAYGWTKMALYSNLIACVMLVPLVIWLALRYGAIGAAAVWVALNLVYVTVNMPIMHRWLLRGELTRWYVQDVTAPLLAGLAVTVIARLVFPASSGWITQLICLAAILLCALAAAALAAPVTRSIVQDAIVRLLGLSVRRQVPERME